MKKGIIGYTGFVGSTLCRQASFDVRFNSSNIAEIRGKGYDLLICAAAPATKWKANQNPEQDILNIQALIAHLQTIKAKRFILISTIDVYPIVSAVDEDTIIDPTLADAYGKHRFYLEEFVRQTFPRHSIVRLPGLFGKGLKKNFIFDLIYNNCLHLTHAESTYQFYNMDRLWTDLQIILSNDLSLVNLATEPVRACDVALRCFDLHFDNHTERVPAHYDMRSKYSHLFGSQSSYLYSANETFEQIRQFASQSRCATSV